MVHAEPTGPHLCDERDTCRKTVRDVSSQKEDILHWMLSQFKFQGIHLLMDTLLMAQPLCGLDMVEKCSHSQK